MSQSKQDYPITKISSCVLY